MLEKVDNMLKKSKNSLILTQLQNLQSLIKSKTAGAIIDTINTCLPASKLAPTTT
jgi:hypothetical protein